MTARVDVGAPRERRANAEAHEGDIGRAPFGSWVCRWAPCWGPALGSLLVWAVVARCFEPPPHVRRPAPLADPAPRQVTAASPSTRAEVAPRRATALGASIRAPTLAPRAPERLTDSSGTEDETGVPLPTSSAEALVTMAAPEPSGPAASAPPPSAIATSTAFSAASAEDFWPGHQ